MRLEFSTNQLADCRAGLTQHGMHYKVVRKELDAKSSSFTNMPDGALLRCCAAADLRTAADYEALLRKKFVGVPVDWVPAIAQQAAAATPSPAGAGRKLPAALVWGGWLWQCLVLLVREQGCRHRMYVSSMSSKRRVWRCTHLLRLSPVCCVQASGCAAPGWMALACCCWVTLHTQSHPCLVSELPLACTTDCMSYLALPAWGLRHTHGCLSVFDLTVQSLCSTYARGTTSTASHAFDQRRSAHVLTAPRARGCCRPGSQLGAGELQGAGQRAGGGGW